MAYLRCFVVVGEELHAEDLRQGEQEGKQPRGGQVQGSLVQGGTTENRDILGHGVPLKIGIFVYGG